MRMYELQNRAEALPVLLKIWENSVRATHHFLSDAEVEKIKEYVPQAIEGVGHLTAAEDEACRIIAFMGIEDKRLEMLFISPEERGKGVGKKLIEYGIEKYGINEVTVNEQNPQAVGFYEHLGFTTYKRTDYDEEGNPYPLLYMKLQKKKGIHMVNIRKAEQGDEHILAYIQTESWKEAFKDIVPSDLLSKCTELERAATMYKRLLEEQRGNGYILEIDGKPHCIAWWCASRDKDMPDYAELACIHSLKDNRHKGYGSMVMRQVLDDVKAAGYSKIMLWVFDNNVRAIKFYEKHGFTASGRKQPALGAVEEMYVLNF